MQCKISNPIDEQETSILILPNQIKSKVSVYSSIQATCNQILRLKDRFPDQVDIIRSDKYGMEFEVPRKWVTIRPPRQMSEEQKQRLAQNLRRSKDNE